MPPLNDDKKILDAYEKWDPMVTPADKFYESIGLSKSGLYGVLRRNKVIPKIRRNDGEPGSDRALLLDIQARLDRIEQHLLENS